MTFKPAEIMNQGTSSFANQPQATAHFPQPMNTPLGNYSVGTAPTINRNQAQPESYN